MQNIKFNYDYRDGANYKNNGEVIFTNPDNIDLLEAEKIIQSKLIDQTWFYVEQWGLKDLYFTTWDNDIDVMWHEFISLVYTDEPPTDTRTFKQFITQIPLQ